MLRAELAKLGSHGTGIHGMHWPDLTGLQGAPAARHCWRPDRGTARVSSPLQPTGFQFREGILPPQDYLTCTGATNRTNLNRPALLGLPCCLPASRPRTQGPHPRHATEYITRPGQACAPPAAITFMVAVRVGERGASTTRGWREAIVALLDERGV